MIIWKANFDTFKEKSETSILKIAMISFSLALVGCSKTEQTPTTETNKTEVASVNEAVVSEAMTVANNTEETEASFAEWKDPKTGLIWLKCKIGDELKNNVCIKAKLAKGSIHEKIRDVTGSLVETDAEGEFTYEQTNKVIGYLNSRNLNGGNQWRLPTIAELAALRQCANGWDKMGEKIEIPNGNSTISVPLKCAEAQNSIFNVFNIVAPVPVGESGGLGVWTSTLAGKDEYGTSKIWTVSSIFGQIGIVDGKNSVDDGVYQNIFLVRDK